MWDIVSASAEFPRFFKISLKIPGRVPIHAATTRMQTRLLAFLDETQRSICSERPEPRPGSVWDASRSVNYTLGLARLVLGSRDPAGKLSPIGCLLLQSFKLADGTLCLKANLTWNESDVEISHPIYAKPVLEWAGEAGLLAAAWLAGPPPKVAPIVQEPELLAAG